MIKLRSFYRLCKVFVSTHPVIDGSRLNTFAVIDSSTDLDTPNLGKEFSEKNKDYFWSRSWAAAGYAKSKIGYQYPGMFLRNPSFEIFQPMQMDKAYYSLEILIVNKYDKTCDIHTRLNHYEIFQQTELYAMHFINFIRDVYIDESGNLVHRTESSVEDFDEISNRRWIRQFHDANTRIDVTRWAGGSDDLWGCLLNVKIPIDICNDDFKYTPVNVTYENSSNESC